MGALKVWDEGLGEWVLLPSEGAPGPPGSGGGSYTDQQAVDAVAAADQYVSNTGDAIDGTLVVPRIESSNDPLIEYIAGDAVRTLIGGVESWSVTVPVDTQEGDIILLLWATLQWRSSSDSVIDAGTFTTPPGFIPNNSHVGAYGTGARGGEWFYKVAEAGDAGSTATVTMTTVGALGVPSFASLFCVVLRNAIPPDESAWEKLDLGASVASPIGAGATTLTKSGLLLAALLIRSDVAPVVDWGLEAAATTAWSTNYVSGVIQYAPVSPGPSPEIPFTEGPAPGAGLLLVPGTTSGTPVVVGTNLSVNNNRVINVNDPVNPRDAVNLQTLEDRIGAHEHDIFTARETAVLDTGPSTLFTGTSQRTKGTVYTLNGDVSFNTVRVYANITQGNTYTAYVCLMSSDTTIDTVLAQASVVSAWGGENYLLIPLGQDIDLVSGNTYGIFIEDSDGNMNSVYTADLATAIGPIASGIGWRSNTTPANGVVGETISNAHYSAGAIGVVKAATEHYVDQAVAAIPAAVAAPVFAYAGTPTAPATGVNGWYNDSGAALTITSIRLSAGTAPSGGTISIDVKVDGVTIFATPLQLADGSSTIKTTTIDTPAVPVDSEVTVDVTENSGAAADITVQIGVS